MKMHVSSNFCKLLFLLTILKATPGQTSYSKRAYFMPPPGNFYQQDDGFVPITYKTDLLSEESQHRRASPKKYSKLIPFNPHSSEEEDYSQSALDYSNEGVGSFSKEGDSQEYSIGTQIRVQHPITIPKKPTSSSSSSSSYTKHGRYSNPYKTSSYTSDPSISSEIVRSPAELTKHKHKSEKYSNSYEPDPFHVIPPPKASASSSHSSYHVYEPEIDEYEKPHSSKSYSSSTSRLKSNSRDRNKGGGAASKKQIDAYFKDQKKLLDEAVKEQLLSNVDYQKYLKSKSKDYYEDDALFDTLSPPSSSSSSLPYRHNFDENLTFKPKRPRRPRPPPVHLKRSPKISIKPRRRLRSPLVITV